MPKKNSKPRAVQSLKDEILTIEFDCSSWIGDVPLDQWTRGPAIPVYGDMKPAKNGKRRGKGRGKRS